MAYKKLSTTETTQCYIKALGKLEFKDKMVMATNMKLLEDNVPNKRYHPITDYTKLEILAKLGAWLNKEYPKK